VEFVVRCANFAAAAKNNAIVNYILITEAHGQLACQ